MKNKLLAFFLLSVVTLMSSLSCGDGYNCGPSPNFFKWTGLEGEIYQVNYSIDTDENLIIDDFLKLDEITGSIIRYYQFSIGLNPQRETYGWQDDSWNFSLMNTANACSPIIPRSEEKIDNIIITANKDFNSDYPMGTDLSPLFNILIIDDFNNIYEERFDLNEYIATNPSVPNFSWLWLKEKPTTLTTFQFKVEFYQQGIDFDYFEFTTANVAVQ